jgi:hypothetical protein
VKTSWSCMLYFHFAPSCRPCIYAWSVLKCGSKTHPSIRAQVPQGSKFWSKWRSADRLLFVEVSHAPQAATRNAALIEPGSGMGWCSIPSSGGSEAVSALDIRFSTNASYVIVATDSHDRFRVLGFTNHHERGAVACRPVWTRGPLRGPEAYLFR